MTAFTVTLNDDNSPMEEDGGQLTFNQVAILKKLLSRSAERSLSLHFSQENQQAFAEEIGYRKALIDFSSHFNINEEFTK